MKKLYIKIGGIINLITALIHAFAGQNDLVNPLQNSSLTVQQRAEWLGVWHMASILLFLGSYVILKSGFFKGSNSSIPQLRFLGILYVLFGFPFIISGLYFSVLAPQWFLLMPIGILLFLGVKETHNQDRVSVDSKRKS